MASDAMEKINRRRKYHIAFAIHSATRTIDQTIRWDDDNNLFVAHSVAKNNEYFPIEQTLDVRNQDKQRTQYEIADS